MDLDTLGAWIFLSGSLDGTAKSAIILKALLTFPGMWRPNGSCDFAVLWFVAVTLHLQTSSRLPYHFHAIPFSCRPGGSSQSLKRRRPSSSTRALQAEVECFLVLAEARVCTTNESSSALCAASFCCSAVGKFFTRILSIASLRFFAPLQRPQSSVLFIAVFCRSHCKIAECRQSFHHM